MTTSGLYVLLSVIALQISAVPDRGPTIPNPNQPQGLPDPMDEPYSIATKPPSNTPTVNPITNKPTSYPTTYEPTVRGQTRAPSVSPSGVPYVSPTSAHTMQSTDDDSISQDASDRNHNGKDDILEFYSIPAIPIQAVCSLITLALFIPVIRHMHFKKTEPKRQIALTIRVPVTLTFLCNNIGIVCIMIVSIMIATADEWDQRMYNLALIPYYTASVTYALGKLFLEIFFIFRVFHAFKQSAFKLSHWMMVLFFIWTLVISVAWFLMFYVVTIDQNLSFRVPYYGYLMLSVVEMLLVVTLLFMFTKRLTKLILLHRINRIEMVSSKTMHTSQRTPESVVSTVSKEGGDINNNESVEYSVSDVKSIQSNLSFRQTRMIFLITRCILTSSFAIVTTILFGVVLFYFEEFGIHIFVVYALWAMDLMTNCICLYLNFTFSTKIYNVCCKICHGACQDMLEYCAAKRLLKQECDESA